MYWATFLLAAVPEDFEKRGSGFDIFKLFARLLVWLMFLRLGGPVSIFGVELKFFVLLSVSVTTFVFFLLSTGLVYWKVLPMASSI